MSSSFLTCKIFGRFGFLLPKWCWHPLYFNNLYFVSILNALKIETLFCGEIKFVWDCFCLFFVHGNGLFNRLKWISFYEKCKIDKASIMFKRIHGALPSYLNEHISINNSRHSRTTRYSNFNVLCPRYNRETEGGRTFLVTGTKIWNELPLRIRMADSIRCFKHNMWTNIFSQQQFLSHFCV